MIALMTTSLCLFLVFHFPCWNMKYIYRHSASWKLRFENNLSTKPRLVGFYPLTWPVWQWDKSPRYAVQWETGWFIWEFSLFHFSSLPASFIKLCSSGHCIAVVICSWLLQRTTTTTTSAAAVTKMTASPIVSSSNNCPFLLYQRTEGWFCRILPWNTISDNDAVLSS